MNKIMAGDDTDEVWECNKDVIIADVASALQINNTEAEAKIQATTIDNPLKFIHRNTKVLVWTE